MMQHPRAATMRRHSTLRSEEVNEGHRFQNPETELHEESHVIIEFLFKRSTLPAEGALQK